MRIRRALVALLTAVVTVGGGIPIVVLFGATPAGAADTTTLASVSSSGGSGNDSSQDEAISADGRYVAFASWATNLVSGGTNGWEQIYVRDLVAGTTDLVSVASDGTQGDNLSDEPSISADGRYVAFASKAANLVPGDTNGRWDVFVRDRVAGTTERVSVSSNGTQSDDDSSDWSIPHPSISGDGRYVAFASYADNLVANDNNFSPDIFVRDRVAGTTERVSISSGGDEADDLSWGPSISSDGRYVAFVSAATNLIVGDSNPCQDVFVHDRETGTTERVSVASDGTQGVCPVNAAAVHNPVISGDGRYVAFDSEFANLVPGDTNGHTDVFVHDRTTGRTARVSVATDGTQGNADADDPSVSADGRYVVFDAGASNLVTGDTNGYWDVFVHDAVTGTTQRVSVAADGSQADFGGGGTAPGISADGATIVFDSSSDNLVSGDTNNTWDVFVREQHSQPFITRPPAELYGHRLTGGYASDPVNTATGNFSETAVDLGFPDAVFGLDWRRTYNSLDTGTGPLGVGWSSGFAPHVAEAPDGSVAFTDWDGRQVTFHPLAGGGWDRPEELFGDLHRDLDGTLSLSFFNGQSWDFDASGRLAAESNWDGQTVTLAYDASSRLTSATSSTGHALTFSYDAADRMSHVGSSDGRGVSYTYDANGALASATDAAGGVTSYTTDSSGRITAITDGDGKPVVANTYDAQGRVASQTTPSADTVTFAYNDATGVTTVTHAGLGSVVFYAHDRDGRLTQVTDPYGALLAKSYDAAGNLTGITDRRGAGTTQTFDGHGNLVSRSSPGGVTETFAYDGADRLVSSSDGEAKTTGYGYTAARRVPSTVTDPNGATSSYTVGADGLVSSETDPDGVTLTFGYDAKRNLTGVTDAAAKTTVLTYDPAGNLASERTPLLHTASYSWDADRRPLSTTDPAGAITSQAWTPAGRLASQTDAANKTTTFAYDPAGRLATETDPLANVASYGYDVDGNLTSVTKPGGSVWHATYDKLGRRLSESDPTGITTSYGYDADGNATATTDAAGKVTARTYDLRGRLTSQTDPLGRATSYTYDHDDRLVSTTDPATAVTAYAYDPAGRLVDTVDPLGKHWASAYTAAGRAASETDPNLHTTTHTYDSLGRLQKTTDPLGGQTRYAYNADGLVTSVTSPAGLITTFGYDAAGRRSTVTDPATGATTTTYTTRGETATVTDASGGTKRYSYDPDGRLATATDANNHASSYGYDGRGNLTSRTDANGGVEHWTYDLADRVLTHADPLNRTTTLSYDPVGRLKQVTDPSARSVTVAYDGAGQVTSRTYGDGSVVSYQYDAAGRPTRTTDTAGVSTSGYDAAGQVTSTTDPNGKTLAYSWDATGNRATMTYPDGTGASFTYDPDNRLVGLAHPQAGTVGYTYNPDGRLLTETLPESVSRAYSYASGRLAGYSETRSGHATTTSFGYDPAGRVSGETLEGVPGGASGYSYDPAEQLTKITGYRATTGISPAILPPGVTIQGQPAERDLTYDASGNRTDDTVLIAGTRVSKTTQGYDAADQPVWASRVTGPAPGQYSCITQVCTSTSESITFAHDNGGRLTAATSSSGPQRTLTYDTRGRLSRTKDRTSPSGPTWTTDRRYDGNGQLLAVTATDPLGSATSTAFTWDDTTAVPQVAVTTSGGADTAYLYGLGRAIAVRNSQGDVFSHDAYANTLAAGTAADLARDIAYDPFGNPASVGSTLFNQLLSLSGDPTKDHKPLLGTRGETQLDGLVHLRARDYAPGLGAFTTPDPLDGTPGTPTVGNPYPYAANDPLDKIDPLGLSPVKDSDLRSPGVIYGPPNPYQTLRSWDYGSEGGVVAAILIAQAGGYNPIVQMPTGYNRYGVPTGYTNTLGSDYVDRYHERLIHDALIDASIAYDNSHMKSSGVMLEKLLISAGAGGAVLIGVCAILPGCAEAAVPAAVAGAGSGPWVDDASDVQQGGAVRQTLQGSCVSACGQMLSGGTLTESQLINELGAPTDPLRLAGQLGDEWTAHYFQVGDALQAALRGPMGAILQVPGQIGHMVVLEPLADGGFLVRDPDPGVTYRVTAEWIGRFVSGGVYR